jgi:2-polyprenyl-6-hydroxyphenyl methylase/3-demethylubiquinone-9 3-methyltransferase
LRLGYIAARVILASARVADIGCGGGILTESLASAGAKVTGIDMAPGPLTVARLHALESGSSATYTQSTAEALRDSAPATFDAVTCLEMLEHVPDVGSVVQACADLTRPGGEVVFSTINRTAAAYLLVVIGAEYVMNLLPRGTHDYARFIRPAELSKHARAAGLEVHDISGMHYNPFSRKASLSKDVSTNYLLHAHKP